MDGIVSASGIIGTQPQGKGGASPNETPRDPNGIPKSFQSLISASLTTGRESTASVRGPEVQGKIAPAQKLSDQLAALQKTLAGSAGSADSETALDSAAKAIGALLEAFDLTEGTATLPALRAQVDGAMEGASLSQMLEAAGVDLSSGENADALVGDLFASVRTLLMLPGARSASAQADALAFPQQMASIGMGSDAETPFTAAVPLASASAKPAPEGAGSPPGSAPLSARSDADPAALKAQSGLPKDMLRTGWPVMRVEGAASVPEGPAQTVGALPTADTGRVGPAPGQLPVLASAAPAAAFGAAGQAAGSAPFDVRLSGYARTGMVAAATGPAKAAGGIEAALQAISALAAEAPAEAEAATAALRTADAPNAAARSGAEVADAPRTALREAQQPSGFARNLASQIKGTSIVEGRTRIELAPRGLGEIEIDLRSDDTGKMRVVIRAENPAVLGAMRLDREHIAAILGGEASFDEATLDFESFQERDEARDGEKDSSVQGAGSGPDETESAGDPAPVTRRAPLGDGEIDIFT